MSNRCILYHGAPAALLASSTLAHSESKMTRILLCSILGVFFQCMHPIKLSSVCIHMLVLSIQLPLRRFAFSPVTHNYLEISYSCRVGGSAAPLGRNVFTWLHNGAIIDLLSPENVAVPGLSPHILFRLENVIGSMAL